VAVSNPAFGSPEHLRLTRHMERQNDLMRQIVALETEVEHLRKYARHHPGGAVNFIPIRAATERQCTCGLVPPQPVRRG
jgi:hypothetical protein